MKAKPPPHRRKFAGEWDEIRYLYGKLLYWLYEREEAGNARAYARRLKRLLSRAAADHEAIFGEECWSLVYEAFGELRKAIEHRQNEIRLIRRLHEICRDSPDQDFLLEGYGYEDLSDRLDLLATLYHDSGKLDEAVAVLNESKRLCRSHGVAFDGDDLLQEYLEESGTTGRAASRSLT